MQAYLGDFAVGVTVRAFFDTFDLGGSPVTIGSLAAHVLKDGSSTPLSTGVSVSTDFDGTGVHVVVVDLSASGATYAAGHDFVIVVSGTVNGASVLRVVAQFSIANRSVIAAAAIADQVWEEALADHSGTSGSTAEALAAAGAAGDPWITPLPGAYGAGTAGQIVGDALDAAVSTRAVAGDAMALTSGERSTFAAALLDLANAIETGVTLRQSQRLMLAALAGKISGAGTTTVTIRNAVADSKDRIVATVDSDGDRIAITTDLT